MLTGCTTGERYLGRVCVLSFRSRREQVETCVDHVTEEARSILARRSGRHEAARGAGH
jgi:hypothetical protein